MIDTPKALSRKELLGKAGRLAVAAAALRPCASALAANNGKARKEKDPDPKEVTPVEDLMREHGLLSRVLFIYDDIRARLDFGEGVPAVQLGEAANVIRTFVEGYHEKLEEEYLFPRFIKNPDLGPLVTILAAQHEAGRRLTQSILDGIRAVTPMEKAALSESIRLFCRMYRPHKAREDTLLFPAFKAAVSSSEYQDLGEKFEAKEHELFGKEGFEGPLARVATIERELGINDLDKFTPRQPDGRPR